MTTSSIPIQDRFPLLREMMFDFAKGFAATLNKTVEYYNVEPQDHFWSLVLPWIAEHDIDNPTPEVREAIAKRKQEVSSIGFDGEKYVQNLRRITSADLHLAECCPSLGLLARHLSRHFVHDAATIWEVLSEPIGLDSLYESFETLTYGSGRFRRSAFTHVFNLNIDGRLVDVGSIRIVRLNPDFKGLLLGEKTVTPFLHPSGIGDCFIFESEPAGELDDAAWLVQKRQAASRFVGLLQYFKSGIVCLGYTVPGFFPDWAHEIRRDGLFFLGEPKRSPYRGGSGLYHIAQSEISQLSSYWETITSPEIAKLMDDRSSNLRQAIFRAGEYYEKSHNTLDAPERLICLAVALEALYSPDNREQLRFRISQNAAQMLGNNPEHKQQIFESVQKLYQLRSTIVHGGYDVAKFSSGTLVDREDLEFWTDLIRRSVLAFLVLALRGERKRTKLLDQLEHAAFDEAACRSLQERADVERFLREASNGTALQS